MIETTLQNIRQEYQSAIDTYSQDVIISHIKLLLSYSNRFYHRQFITRKNVQNGLLVQYISDKLNVSPNYLSDMLRALTGQSTQQHIQDKLIL